MKTMQAGTRIALKNILFLTDFSEPSDTALSHAVSVAREYGATLHALHVLIPEPYTFATVELGDLAMQAQEEAAEDSMRRVNAQMEGLPHESTIVRGGGVWPSTQESIEQCSADMLVLGTHGRTGAHKILMGSVAEEIFRRSSVPVMMIGPGVRSISHNAGRFRRVLFATDFGKESEAALPYAVSLAEENQSELILLHVIPEPKDRAERESQEISSAEAMHRLHELVPATAELWCRPGTMAKYGKPGPTILETAEEVGADLIVLGVRKAEGVPGAATHLGISVAHNIVAHAKCPVLAVRG